MIPIRPVSEIKPASSSGLTSRMTSTLVSEMLGYWFDDAYDGLVKPASKSHSVKKKARRKRSSYRRLSKFEVVVTSTRSTIEPRHRHDPLVLVSIAVTVH